MSKNYRSLTDEMHDTRLTLEKAYDRGYQQGKIDYEPPEAYWMFTMGKRCGEYVCLWCKEKSFAPTKYCQCCGAKMTFVKGSKI